MRAGMESCQVRNALHTCRLVGLPHPFGRGWSRPALSSGVEVELLAQHRDRGRDLLVPAGGRLKGFSHLVVDLGSQEERERESQSRLDRGRETQARYQTDIVT